MRHHHHHHHHNIIDDDEVNEYITIRYKQTLLSKVLRRWPLPMLQWRWRLGGGRRYGGGATGAGGGRGAGCGTAAGRRCLGLHLPHGDLTKEPRRIAEASVEVPQANGSRDRRGGRRWRWRGAPRWRFLECVGALALRSDLQRRRWRRGRRGRGRERTRR